MKKTILLILTAFSAFIISGCGPNQELLNELKAEISEYKATISNLNQELEKNREKLNECKNSGFKPLWDQPDTESFLIQYNSMIIPFGYAEVSGYLELIDKEEIDGSIIQVQTLFLTESVAPLTRKIEEESGRAFFHQKKDGTPGFNIATDCLSEAEKEKLKKSSPNNPVKMIVLFKPIKPMGMISSKFPMGHIIKVLN